ncbi:MAG: hypothetical protein FJ333_09185, partial [Sphingomonadales bacterium]|nr:hypothetical protein [Sphingomonadales bacterium]
MTLIQIEGADWSAEERSEFLPIAESVNRHIEDFYQHRQQGQHAKMKAIGELEEYKRKHPQRSKAARLINAGYKAEEWSEATISENATAYRQYVRLQGMRDKKISEFAEQAPVFLLTAMGRQQEIIDKTDDWSHEVQLKCLWQPAFTYWKKHRRYPTLKQVRGFLGGYTTDEFVFFSTLRSKTESSDARKLSSSEQTEAPTNSTRIQMELLAMPTVDVFEPAPTTTDLPAALPTADRVQQGIDMLIESLHLIG